MLSDDAVRTPDAEGIRMTYAEIAERLHVSGEAARQVVRRRGWRRIVPNRPGATTIVIVPVDELAGMHGRDTRTPDIGDTRPPDDPSAFETALTAIEAAHASEVAALRAQVDTSEQARIAAEQQLRSALELADRSMAQLADTSLRADRDEALIRNLEADLRAKDGTIAEGETRAREAEQAVRIALGTVETLRKADEARKARGRIRRAWDGWRGR
jgi:hypothetical protein